MRTLATLAARDHRRCRLSAPPRAFRALGSGPCHTCGWSHCSFTHQAASIRHPTREGVSRDPFPPVFPCIAFAFGWRAYERSGALRCRWNLDGALCLSRSSLARWSWCILRADLLNPTIREIVRIVHSVYCRDCWSHSYDLRGTVRPVWARATRRNSY